MLILVKHEILVIGNPLQHTRREYRLMALAGLRNANQHVDPATIVDKLDAVRERMSTLSSPMPKIPPALSELMAEIGPRWREDIRGHIRLMLEKFSEVLADAPRDGVVATRGIRYGKHLRREFDLYTAAEGGKKRPALLFVHGGAFLDGHRNRTNMIYSNVLYYFARHGIVGINIGYRLSAR